ncbi:MAG TPA: CHAT domain-containing tetratricopeptide repeat protein [Thermoanaerobaculia bacterium]
MPQSEKHAAAAARTAIDRSEYALAETIIRDALQKYGKRDAESVWALRVMHGELLNLLRKPKEADTALAFELPAKFRQSETAVQQRLQRAFVAYYLNKAAMPKFLESAKALAEKHQPAALAEVFRGMAAVEGAEDAVKAERYGRQAIALARKHRRRVTEVKATDAVALRLVQRQDYAEAIELEEKVRPIARELGLRRVLQSIEGNLGWAYFELGHYDTAEELFASAEKTADQIGERNLRAGWLIQLGNVEFQKRRYATADEYNKQALAAGATDERRGYALANRARAAFERGLFAEARRLNDEALKAKRAANDDEAEHSSNIVAARIAAVDDRDFKRAEKLLAGVLPHTKKNKLEAEAVLADVYALMGRPKDARDYYERAVQTARETRNEVKDKELRFAFFNTVERMFDEYVDFLVAQKEYDEALRVTEISRAESLEEGRVQTGARKLDPKRVAKENGAVILSYWLGRDRSYLWVITEKAVTLHQLPADTRIEKDVETYGAALRDHIRGTMAASGARGRQLYDMLVAAAKVPKDARVIVIADGKLHALNFDTLVAPGPQRYWLRDVIVTYSGSLQLLTLPPARRGADASMLLVGDPPAADASFPRLPYAAKEMRAVEKHFAKRKVLEHEKATPSAYHQASPGTFDYIHFVAHGVATRKRPLDSAVILARDAKSYKLLARAVLADKLQARLVTISSCHGAGTRTYAGEGVIGLAWAFLRAGADQVIASLWEVKDASTPKLMDEMYRHIRAGDDPAVALRKAKLTLLDSNGTWQRPVYWAPFVLYAGTDAR